MAREVLEEGLLSVIVTDVSPTLARSSLEFRLKIRSEVRFEGVETGSRQETSNLDPIPSLLSVQVCVHLLSKTDCFDLIFFRGSALTFLCREAS